MMTNKENEAERNLLVTRHKMHEDPYRVFNIAFSLMTVIPFLVFFYVLVTELFGVEILAGKVGGVLLIALGIAML
ncbi:MAG: hypothetical protein KKB12_01840, partial [Candidatus Omnitrophica bacterium]|nr:hypothetical protein [Candidatus Omnitrophota bacterium]